MRIHSACALAFVIACAADDDAAPADTGSSGSTAPTTSVTSATSTTDASTSSAATTAVDSSSESSADASESGSESSTGDYVRQHLLLEADFESADPWAGFSNEQHC